MKWAIGVVTLLGPSVGQAPARAQPAQQIAALLQSSDAEIAAYLSANPATAERLLRDASEAGTDATFCTVGNALRKAIAQLRAAGRTADADRLLAALPMANQPIQSAFADGCGRTAAGFEPGFAGASFSILGIIAPTAYGGTASGAGGAVSPVKP